MRKPGWSALVLSAGIAACANLIGGEAAAQSYPNKPIRMLVGFAVGGAVDVTARIVAQKFSEQLGQQVVVENRTGAGGVIASDAVAKAPPDGYTLLMLSISDTVLPALRKLPYDLERDFSPVSLVTVLPLILVVHPSVPARNVSELIALTRARPGGLNFASSGIGSSAHLAIELFNLMAKVKFVHVPYKGGAESALAVASGHVDLCIASITAVLPIMNKVRPLAVTSARRASSMPAIPTIDEAGLRGYDHYGWNGVIAPAGVPKDIIARLNAVLAKAINTAEMKETLDKQGVEPRTDTPEQFGAFIHDAIARNTRLMRLAGARSE
jgi:tripartite-type tricarboxylate transporter receptor subunit TctC